jgi:hypothetical protein
MTARGDPGAVPPIGRTLSSTRLAPMPVEVRPLAEAALSVLGRRSGDDAASTSTATLRPLFRQEVFSESAVAADEAEAPVEGLLHILLDVVLPLGTILCIALGIALLALIARTAGVNSDSEEVARAVRQLVREAGPAALGLVGASVALLVLVVAPINLVRDMTAVARQVSQQRPGDLRYRDPDC